MSELMNKIILLTGAGGGIGRAAAQVFAHAGARIALTDVNTDAGQQTFDAVKNLGGDAAFFEANLGSEADVIALVQQTVEHFGGLDGAFNNAGTAQHGLALHELSTEQWTKTIHIDLTTVFWCMKYEIKAMLPRGAGAIVNTSSGLGARAIANAAEYISAKHGVIGLTRAAAVEYARNGIRSNCVLPGIIETPMVKQLSADPSFADFLGELKARHPVGRFGKPSEVGEAVKWLLSDAASFVNGEAFAVDGGYLAN
jgi:NAD(P)-dependent dehydrogenase (short-subunit alcohol dehydrogenase family)